MKILLLTLFFAFPLLIFSQQRSSLCDNVPNAYEQRIPPPALPKFQTKAVTEYKVQVAILKRSKPSEYAFYPSLVAYYRPCQQAWVVESKQSFRSRQEAEKLRTQLKNLGYRDAYITEIIAYN